MSNWIEKRQELAKLLYNKLVAMKLHFQPGSIYDYGKYHGKIKKAKEIPRLDNEIYKVSNYLLAKDISFDEYVFANVRKSPRIISKQFSHKVYEDWKALYGSKEAFRTTIMDFLQEKVVQYTDTEELILYLLSTNEVNSTESLLYLMHLYPNLREYALREATENALFKVKYNEAIKHFSIYNFLGIV